MEASSPLAALQRPVPVPSWGSQDMFRSHPHSHFSTTSSAAGSLGLREQLHKSTGDYFGATETRGSSPAASLAADLSQNFRIDSAARSVSLTLVCLAMHCSDMILYVVRISPLPGVPCSQQT
jgi:M-phase inducer tyrosine phosphatase